MDPTYISDKEYQGMDFGEKPLERGDYENCMFKNCILTHANLSAISFIECEFESCDLSMANVNGTAFREVKFRNSKLLGIHFEHTNEFLFSIAFVGCQLNLCSFYNRSLKGTDFENCNLQEADFAGADLTGATFNNCDLHGALFDNTILEKADLRSSYGFSIDPEMNRIKKARFSLNGVTGLLSKYDIEIT